jgi:hypothetical protein
LEVTLLAHREDSVTTLTEMRSCFSIGKHKNPAPCVSTKPGLMDPPILPVAAPVGSLPQRYKTKGVVAMRWLKAACVAVTLLATAVMAAVRAASALVDLWRRF